jgi:hypothetical protein
MRGYFGKCQELIANVEIFLAISFNLQRNPPRSVAATTNLCVFPFSRRNLLSMCAPNNAWLVGSDCTSNVWRRKVGIVFFGNPSAGISKLIGDHFANSRLRLDNFSRTGIAPVTYMRLADTCRSRCSRLKLICHYDRLCLWKEKRNSPSLTLASGSGLFLPWPVGRIPFTHANRVHDLS